jgi:hypothetical protein
MFPEDSSEKLCRAIKTVAKKSMSAGRFFVACFLATLAGGCGSQTPVAPSESTPAAQTTGVVQPGATILHHDGCTIDIAKVCKSYIDQPQFTYNGDEYDWTRFQGSVFRHPDLDIWARYPDGSVVAEIECHIDAQNRKVDWARLLPNPPMTDKAWEYAKSEQWCQEEWPDYSAWGQYGISHQGGEKTLAL